MTPAAVSAPELIEVKFRQLPSLLNPDDSYRLPVEALASHPPTDDDAEDDDTPIYVEGEV